MTTTPSEHDIHAYVDGRLEGERREAVELYLARHPERAAKVQAWQRDAQRLRAALGGPQALPDNAALLPGAVRMKRQRRRIARLSLAAAAMLCLGVGGFGGWQMRGMRSDTAAAPMADAIEAYRLVALDHAARPDMVAQRPGDLQRWLDTRFEHAARLPDLTGAGFHPVVGRLFATDQGPAAMVLYRDTAGHTISFYVRPPGPRNHLLPDGQRVDGGLLAQYWSGEGYNYAMVSRDDGVDPQVAAQAKRRAI